LFTGLSGFDLGNVRPHVRQHLAAERPGHDLREVKHLQLLQWQHPVKPSVPVRFPRRSLSTRPPGQVLRGLPGQSRIRDEHEAILTAIRRGDVEAAQDKMVAHMNQDVQRGLANFDRIRGV